MAISGKTRSVIVISGLISLILIVYTNNLALNDQPTSIGNSTDHGITQGQIVTGETSVTSGITVTHHSANDNLIPQSTSSTELNSTSSPASSKVAVSAVLFTTFKNSTEKEFIYSNTVRNWASFRPYVQPVLFATFSSGPIIDLARENGWMVYPCPRVNDQGTPFLKDMYAGISQRFHSQLTAFSNGDILYDNGLVETLKEATNQRQLLKTTFIVGRRWNHKINSDRNVYSADPLWNPNKVKAVAQKGKSGLFREDAQDYFFVTEDFPWVNIKDVVVGRPGYDNYLVAMANTLKVSTVDATNTISAVHQTGSDGNYAGHTKANKDKGFNHNLIGRFNYGAGLTRHCRYVTKFSGNAVQIIKR